MARVVDLVCEMKFDESEAVARSEWCGQTYYFCHPVCQRIFNVNPARFTEKNNRKRTKNFKHKSLARRQQIAS